MQFLVPRAGTDAFSRRRGAMLVLVCVVLVLLLAMTMFTVDVAFMQLTRSELRAVTDASAKAGAEALRRTGDPVAAKNAAISIAGKNTVGGHNVILTPDEIELGRSVRRNNGRWEFVANQTPYTSVRVNAAMGGTSSNPPVRLFFAGIFGDGTFEPQRSATAAHSTVELCLCLDRSHSMCFDLSGIEWVYPANLSGLIALRSAPHSTGSRWAALEGAVDLFLDSVSGQPVRPRVALVTWGSEISLNSHQGRLTGKSFREVTPEVGLTRDYGPLRERIEELGSDTMLGATNMSAGIDESIVVLQNSEDLLASKIIVLMSDGQWNQGRDPVQAAADAANAGITIHTIGFLGGEGSTLEVIAEITGGRYFPASSAGELRDAFAEIARTLPVILTE